MTLTKKQRSLLCVIGSGQPYIWDNYDMVVARNLVRKGLIEVGQCATRARLTDAGKEAYEGYRKKGL